VEAVKYLDKEGFKEEVIFYSKEILKLDSNNKLAKEFLNVTFKTLRKPVRLCFWLTLNLKENNFASKK